MKLKANIMRLIMDKTGASRHKIVAVIEGRRFDPALREAINDVLTDEEIRQKEFEQRIKELA